MPNKITAYQCQFKCGHSPFNRECACIEHEEHCIRNPLNMTCATCMWDIREKHSAGSYIDNNYHEWIESGCYKNEQTKRPDKGFMRNCQSWSFDTRKTSKRDFYTDSLLIESEEKTRHVYKMLSKCTNLRKIEREWSRGNETIQ